MQLGRGLGSELGLSVYLLDAQSPKSLVDITFIPKIAKEATPTLVFLLRRMHRYMEQDSHCMA